jgi:putative peptidoglycan lipid II flippase
MSARSLTAYATGLLAFALIKVLAPGFYARQDTRTPVRVGVKAMLTNVLLNAVLVWPLAHAGLALATALAAYLNAGLLYRGLRKADVYAPEPGWRGFLARIGLANGLMAWLLISATGELHEWLAWGAPERAWRLLLLVGSGAFVYIGALWVAGLRWQHMRLSSSTV